MSEFVIRRVVIACDAVGEHRSSIELAARFAGWWNAPLHGVFVEDETLLHLAALPFARHVAASGEIAKDYDEAAMLHHFEAHATRLRLALEAAAREHAVGWSFDVVRGQPRLATLALAEEDLLVIESASRPFAGDFRLDSPWLAAAFQAQRSILLIRNASTSRDGVTVLVRKPGSSADRTIAAAARIAAAGNRRLRVVLAAPSFDKTAVLAQIGRVSEKIAAHCSIEQNNFPATGFVPGESAGGILVVDADPAACGEGELKQLVARTSADILFVR